MRGDARTAHYTNPSPTHCDDEYLPTDWQTYAETKGIAEPDIWPLWTKFKAITKWPFERRRWFAFIDAVVRNRASRRDQ